MHANLVLNVGPRGDGSFPEEEILTLQAEICGNLREAFEDFLYSLYGFKDIRILKKRNKYKKIQNNIIIVNCEQINDLKEE